MSRFLCATVLSLGLLAGCARDDTVRLFDDMIPPYPPAPVSSRVDAEPFAVIIDPGHGGPEPGARIRIGEETICEDEIAYDIAWRLALRLSRFAEDPTFDIPFRKPILTVWDNRPLASTATPVCDDGSHEAFYTPDGMKPIRPVRDGGLADRTGVISAWYDELQGMGYAPDRIVLVSIHADFAPADRQGAHVIYPGLVYDKLWQEGDGRNNAWSSMVHATYLMHGLETMGVQRHVSDVGRAVPLFRGYHIVATGNPHQQHGRLAIFRDTPRMAKVLVEAGNLNHPVDSRRLITPEYRQTVAEGLFHGLQRYAKSGGG